MGPQPAVAAVRLAVRRALADLPAASRRALRADPPAEAPERPLVLVACSGGADSLALAAATAKEAARAGLRAGAVTVDHGLQAGSAAHARHLADLLRERLRLDPVEVARVAVGTTGGPEAAARAARYAALDETADRLRAAAVLLGHTRDDQAETVLLGLARGSGARSLAGMADVSGPGGRYRRPLLDLDRATVRRACLGEGLPVWDDPHNADPSFTRVRVRTQALPALERALKPAGGTSVAAALARTARLLRDDADALDAWAERAAEACAADADEPAGGEGATALRVDALETLPPAVRRRVLRATARRAGSPPTDLSERHVAALDALVTAWHGQGPLHLPGGVEAQRRCGRLLIAQAGAGAAPERA